MKQNRILYLSLFFLSLSFVYFYGGKIPYMLFFLIICFPIFSLAYSFLIYLRFKYVQNIDKKFLIKGEKAIFDFTITNEDPLIYPYITVNFYGMQAFFAEQSLSKHMSLLPFETRTFSFELDCKYRGTYDIGVRSVDIMDLLGIFKLSYRIFDQKDITVYPRIVNLDFFKLNTDYINESPISHKSANEDITSIQDIRKYAYGDSIKRIHWKLSSKLNELVIKKFQNSFETHTAVIIDLKKYSLSQEKNLILEDKIIETAVAIIHYCLKKWIPLDFVYYTSRYFSYEAKNPSNFQDLYTKLTKIEFDQQVDFKDLMELYISNTLNKTNIVIITCKINYELYDIIYKTHFSDFNVSLIYIYDDIIDDKSSSEIEMILNKLPEIGIQIYKIDVNDDIKSVLESQK